MSVFVYPLQQASIPGVATEATLQQVLTETQAINANTADVATETTLSALNAKVVTADTDNVTITSSVLPTGAATEATLSALDAKVVAVDTGAVVVSSSALPTGAATEATLSAAAADLATIDTNVASMEADLAALNARLAGSLVPEQFDYQDIAYKVGGNGDGQIETVIYKTGGALGTTVATLTLAYDGQNRLISVTRS